MAKRISDERKGAFYFGSALMVLGLLTFGSMFVSFAMNFGDFTNFDSLGRSMVLRGIGGMAMLFIGGFIRIAGARGMAGSGIVLDPERAKEDLEPYSRMVGGMAKDVLEEADVNLGGRSEQVVMIRCTTCKKLNEEDSKFCQECGAEI